MGSGNCHIYCKYYAVPPIVEHYIRSAVVYRFISVVSPVLA
jgi:hypothetical protein